MKVLYISNRLNASDGSSVHGRAFAASVKQLGHNIVTYPEIRPIEFHNWVKTSKRRTALYYIRKINLKTLKYYLKKSSSLINDIISYYDGLKRNKKHFKEIEQIYLSFKPDVIVFRHTLYDNAPLLVKNKYNIPCIIEVNSIKSIESQLYKNNKAGIIPRRAELTSLCQSDYAFCVSDPIKDWIDNATNSHKTYVIPNGVDTDVFNVNNFDIDKEKDLLGLKGKKIVGYIGSYKKWHGLDTSVDTINELKKSDPDFHLLLIGNGEEYQNIKKQIDVMGLQEHVTQIDYINHSESPRYLAMFDYALMTYPVMEGFYFSPLKMFEYLSMSIPVISTQIGQIATILTHEKTGILVPTPTYEHFSEEILNLDKHPDLLSSIRQHSRQLAVDELSWVSNARRVLALCEKAVNNNNNNK